MKLKFGKVEIVDNVAQLNFKEVETNDTLQLMYDEIGCDCIDIPFVSNLYGQNNIDVVIDDEGKLKEDKAITGLIVNEDGFVIDTIVGNYLLMSHNDDGDTVSLTDEQIFKIKQSFRLATTNICSDIVSVIPV